MAKINKNQNPQNMNRSYLAKDFVGFRNDLLKHAKIYFPENNRDFSEASLGGLFLEMAAYVGDTLSYYLDHQFNELNFETAIETENLEQHIRNAGVKITGNAPGVMFVRFLARIPTVLKNGQYIADEQSMPVIKKGTSVSTDIGIIFELTEDLDFAEKDADEKLIANIVSGNAVNGVPNYYVMSREGLCVSGKSVAESFTIPDSDKPFRELVLSNPHVSAISKVYDTRGNEYFEVDSLSQDTVFVAVDNSNFSNDGVKYNLTVKSADRKFIKKTSINTRTTTIQFGSGSPDSLNDDIIVDPADLSLPLYGRKTLSKFSIDPAQILNSKTMGIYPKNTKITVVYRYGGGSSHNVDANSVTGISSLDVVFRNGCPPTNREVVVNSMAVQNDKPASGAANAPTIEELRSLIPAARNMQNRIVTRQDLFARLYTLPSEFGRIHKASITSNPNNPLASTVYILSQDSAGSLALAPDALKRNLRVYLNEFRLISEAYDILDAEIINYKVSIEVVPVPGLSVSSIANEIILRVKDYTTALFDLGQPIIKSDITNLVITTPGVLSVGDITLRNLVGNIQDRVYSNDFYNFDANLRNGIYSIPQNSIFELKYPDFDIEVTI